MAFDHKAFATHLLAESLFYDEEFGAIGNISLVDREAAREVFVAYYVPEDGLYIVDVATAWDTIEGDDEIGYAFASDGDEHFTTASAEEMAEKLMALAEEQNLAPSMAILFEDDESGGA